MPLAINSQYFSLPDGRRLWVMVAGEGPAVLLLHGGTCDHTDWLAQVHALGGDYRLIVPDMPFHGRSDDNPNGYGMDGHARDCLALLDILGVERVVVVGHSMGGFVTRLLYEMTPACFRAVVIVDSRGALPQLLELPKAKEKFPSEFNLNRLARFERSKQALAQRVGGLSVLENPPKATAQTWCHVPLLAFFASGGAVCPADLVRHVERDLSTARSRLVIVPDCGHWVMCEKPDVFNDELGKFLAGLPPVAT